MDNKERLRNRCIDLKGKRVGMLTVVSKTEKRKNGYVVWKCQCDCGNVVYITSNNLKYGLAKSCGCSRWKTRRKNKEEEK